MQTCIRVAAPRTSTRVLWAWPASPLQLHCSPSPTVDGSRRAAHAAAKFDSDGKTLPIDEKTALLLQTSNRFVKRRNSSPSRVLEDAFAYTEKYYALPAKVRGKVDLSYMSPYERNQTRHKAELLRGQYQFSRKRNKPRLSLQTITATLIRNDPGGATDGWSKRSPHYRRYIASLFTEEEQEYLASRKYNFGDVREWARIITQRDAELATKIMHTHLAGGTANSITRIPLPTFVPLFLLRRQVGRLGPKTLRNLLVYIWQQIHRMVSRRSYDLNLAHHWEHRYPSHWSNYPTLDHSAAYIQIVRLIRHARHTYPEALVTLAAMISYIWGPKSFASNKPEKRGQSESRQRTTVLYNRALLLIGLADGFRPVKSVSYYQRAQFDLLKSMAEHDPPIDITREGYRAIVSVQLMNKKTVKERDWARLKASSWPPWKQERTGLDAYKGPKDGVSRAMEALNRAREAGYAKSEWDNAAQILAGWDVDQTPTIQTRAVLLHRSVSRRDILLSTSPRSLEEKTRDQSSTLWASRIRTTRTVQEAWACFLRWQERAPRASEDVYFAMLEKVAFEAERRKRVRNRPFPGGGDTPLTKWATLDAGDAKELVSAPTSPRESTYVRTEPPSFHELAELMFSNGVRPSSETLSFLLAHAGALEEGLGYLAWATRYEDALKSLLSPELDNKAQLKRLHSTVVSAYIALLCRFPSIIPQTRDNSNMDNRRSLRPEVLLLRQHFTAVAPLDFALKVLKATKPRFPRAYHTVIEAISYLRHPLPISQIQEATPAQWIQRLSATNMIVTFMSEANVQPDLETFFLQCRARERAIFAALELQKQSDEGITAFEDVESPAHNVLASSTLVRQQFANLFAVRASDSADDAATSIPRILAAPDPATLHAYVRVLGLLRDWAGIQDMAAWVAAHQEELAFRVGWAANDLRMMRKVFTATRVFLERAWTDAWAEGRVPDLAAPEHVRESVRRSVQRVERWGGWATDDEVAEYCSFQFADFPEL